MFLKGKNFGNWWQEDLNFVEQIIYREYAWFFIEIWLIHSKVNFGYYI